MMTQQEIDRELKRREDDRALYNTFPQEWANREWEKMWAETFKPLCADCKSVNEEADTITKYLKATKNKRWLVGTDGKELYWVYSPFSRDITSARAMLKKVME